VTMLLKFAYEFPKRTPQASHSRTTTRLSGLSRLSTSQVFPSKRLNARIPPRGLYRLGGDSMNKSKTIRATNGQREPYHRSGAPRPLPDPPVTSREQHRQCLLRPRFFPLAVIVETVARMICAVCGSFLSATAREGHRFRFLSAVCGAPTSRDLLFCCAVNGHQIQRLEERCLWAGLWALYRVE
jgi:hypothetical protein